jgi:hypothetical protein
MPYAYDLARLTTSSLDEHSGWLRSSANPTDESNNDFWREVDGRPDAGPPDTIGKP